MLVLVVALLFFFLFFDEGEAGSASVVGSCALMGSLFDNGSTPAAAASVSRSLSVLRFCPFPLLAMLVAVGVAGTPAAAASVLRWFSVLRFRPFPLLAMLVAVGVAGCAYVVNYCASTGVSFDDGGVPSKAASVRSFHFRSFLLLFGEAMLVRVGGVVWECAAGRMFRVCAWIRSLKSKRM